jgi:hypothetical protein
MDVLSPDPLDEIGLRRHAHGDPDTAVVRGRQDRTAGREGQEEEGAFHDGDHSLRARKPGAKDPKDCKDCKDCRDNKDKKKGLELRSALFLGPCSPCSPLGP